MLEGRNNFAKKVFDKKKLLADCKELYLRLDIPL